jgi:hypothetical protein
VNKSLVAGHYVFAFSVERRKELCCIYSKTKKKEELRGEVFARFRNLLEPLLP